MMIPSPYPIYVKLALRTILVLFPLLVAIVGANGQTWTTANPGNWSNPATWTSNTVPPTNVSMGTVTLAHSVTLDQNAIAGTLNINAGTLTTSVSNTLSVTGTATIANGAIFTNSSSNAANISISNFVVSNGGTYNHNAVGSSLNGAATDFPGTTRSFGASSNVLITKWAQSGGIPIALPASGSPGWGNLTIAIDNSITYASAATPYTQAWNQYGNMTNIQGNLNISRPGTTSPNEFRFFGQATNASLIIKGNVNISGGRVAMVGDGFGNSKTMTIRVKGDFTLSGSATFDLTSSYANLGGFHNTYLYLEGNLVIQNSAKFQRYRTNTVNGIAFVKPTGVQTFSSQLSGLNTGNPGVGFAVGDGTTINTLKLLTPFLSLQTATGTFPSLGNRFEVFKNATLECSAENYMQGWGFLADAGSTLIIGSKDGIETVSTTAKGSVRMITTTFGAMYNSATHYIYNGSYNQVTGNGLPTTITGSLSISNTGSANNNIVTLTTTNTETKTLNLNSGYFAAGTGRTLKISNTGSINGAAGGDCIYLTSNGGNIHLLGNNTVTGSAPGFPHFYDLTIGSGIVSSPVTFSQNGTIYHYCTVNTEGSVNPKPPTYATGSTLIYNTANGAASPYNRNIEWKSATSGVPGYPWHVVVQNGTNLNLGSTVPPLLECGGNLTIGVLGAGSGTVNMNSLSQPLIVKGHLTIGDTITANPVGTLNLSSVYGGDLWLYGNFSRGKNSIYTDNSRAIYFKGSNDASINTPGITITPAQYFSYAYIDKTNGTETVTLNCPVGINNEIGFTKGVVTTSVTNLLSVTNSTTGSVTGGSNLSFVNGPMARAVNSASTYDFPVGKTGAINVWRPVSVIPVASTAANFLAEYFKGPTPNNTTLLSTITSLENNEYWNINRTTGTTNASVKLNYINPGTGTSKWTPIDPCTDCYVGVAQYNNAGTGYWDFTKSSIDFNPAIPETRLNTSNGPLYSAVINNFSLAKPFTPAAYYNIILPVQLLQFTAKLLGKDGRLDWQIASSADLAGFELQHSSNGRNFTGLASLPAASSNAYNYHHRQLAAGAHFYRLLVKEKNGRSFYSQVLLLMVGNIKTQIIGLANNPVSTFVTPLVLSAADQKMEVVIRDAVGKLLYWQQGSLKTGQNQWPISAAAFARGLYFITIITADGENATLKFIKQ